MKKILVIDDDSAMLALTVKALQARGFQTVTADDGVAGLEMAKKHRAQVKREPLAKGGDEIILYRSQHSLQQEYDEQGSHHQVQ